MNPCGPNATCLDTERSFNCTCNPGFSGDGLNCSSKFNIMSPNINSNTHNIKMRMNVMKILATQMLHVWTLKDPLSATVMMVSLELD